MNLSISRLQKAVRKTFPQAIVNGYQKFPGGDINNTYKLDVKNIDKSLIFKRYNKMSGIWKSKKETNLYNIIRNNSNIPIPDVYVCDPTLETLPFPYIIMSEIPGKTLEDIYKDAEPDLKLNFAEKIGETLSDLHKIKFDDFGVLGSSGIPQSFDNMAEWYKYKLAHFSKEALFGTYLPKKLVREIEEYAIDNIHLLDMEIKPCLVHNDLNTENVKFLDGEVVGIYDFEMAVSVHNEYEFVKMNWSMPNDKKFREKVIDSYLKKGKLSSEFEERLKLYELQRGMGLSKFLHERGYKERGEKIIEIMKGHLDSD